MKQLSLLIFALVVMLPAWGIDIYKYKLPEVKADFVEKYNEVTNENLNQFFADWEQWSVTYGASKTDNNFDALFQRCFNEVRTEHLSKGWSIRDNVEYELLPSQVAVFQSNMSLSEIEKFENPKIHDDKLNSNITSVSCFVPHITSSKKVLYMTGEIRKVIYAYFDKLDAGGTPMDNWKIGKFINVARHHSGWCYLVEESLPCVDKIISVTDGHYMMYHECHFAGENRSIPAEGPSRVTSSWMH